MYTLIYYPTPENPAYKNKVQVTWAYKYKDIYYSFTLGGKNLEKMWMSINRKEIGEQRWSCSHHVITWNSRTD